MALDLTFGTNKQRRPLFVVAGVDGSNKSFTMFRAFMPSKEHRAVRWVMLKALPMLLGRDILQRVSVIATDMEPALSEAISSGVTMKIFPQAKHRLDYFHMFVIPWREHIRKETELTTTIYNWIRTWFDELETDNEFSVSRNLLKTYIHSHKSELSESQVLGLNEIVDRIVSHIIYCGNHCFMNHATYGFTGDTICESINNSIKSGTFAVDSRMDVDRSGITMMQRVTGKSEDRNW